MKKPHIPNTSIPKVHIKASATNNGKTKVTTEVSQNHTVKRDSKKV